jgi:beta-1,4-mannosyl-glycoprotein beta-1,4-N-acetylglucosaminyltransferase
MWFDEVDVLELRLRLLDGLADRFVAVESDLTHSGLTKGWRLGDHRERLEPWWDRLTWVKVSGVAGEPSWVAENRQRRACQTAVAELGPDDIVVVSDVDEVWGPEALAAWGDDIRVAHQDFRLFSALWRWESPWPGSIGGPWSKMMATDWQTLRNARHSLPSIRSGWHFSWMGDVEAMRRKQQAYAHRGFSDVDVERFVAEGRWFDGTILFETEQGLPDGLPPAWFRRRTAIL